VNKIQLNSDSDVTLVILVYNEIEALTKLIPKIPFFLFSDVFAIDGGSTDGSINFLESKGIRVIVQKKKGRGNGFIEALPHLKSKYVIFFSGDGNENEDDLPKMVNFLQKGYDLVIAGRFFKRNANFDVSDDPLRFRKLGSLLICGIVNLFWKTGVIDVLNGFRGFKVESLKKMKLDAPHHEIELQSTIRAKKLNMKIIEFPTIEKARLGGNRKDTASTLKMALNINKYLIKELFIKL